MISTASAAEIAIKASIGKLTFAMPLVELWEGGIRNAGIIPIPLTGRHALRTAALPLHHRDPFDRLLIGVALEEDLTLLTDDAAIHRYEVKAIW